MTREFLIILALVFSLLSLSAEAKSSTSRQTVNVLTWWGYLDDHKIIDSVENKCDVNISYDNYLSNDEFIRRWDANKGSYDIIIFSQTIYDVIKNKIPNLSKSKLSTVSSLYHPEIKKHYVLSHYPNNVVYFVHSLTGFLWNPMAINISERDSVNDIFKKAANKYVIIIDDPTEVNKLINAGSNLRTNNYSLNKTAFGQLVSRSVVYISNDYSKIYEKPEFAFSFTWSGEAFTDLSESKKKFKFLIHPNLSYVSSDLLAQVSNNKKAMCVSRALTSKETMSELQNYGYYFTPYADYSRVSNISFRDMYIRFVNSLPKLQWIESMDQKSFDDMSKEWQLVKIEYSKKSRNY